MSGESRLTPLHDLRLLCRGAHLGHRLATVRRGREVALTPIEAIACETDGEPAEALPMYVRIVPGAVRPVI